MFYDCEKVEKTIWFSALFIFKRQPAWQVQKGEGVGEGGKHKREKGRSLTLSPQSLGPWGGASPYKILLGTPRVISTKCFLPCLAEKQVGS